MNTTNLDTKLAEIQARVDKAPHITTLEWKHFALAIGDLRFCLQTIAELREDRERLAGLLESCIPNPFGNSRIDVIRQTIDAARGKEKV